MSATANSSISNEAVGRWFQRRHNLRLHHRSVDET
jgi:hypothetical protein